MLLQTQSTNEFPKPALAWRYRLRSNWQGLCLAFLLTAPAIANTGYHQDAAMIRNTYERQLYTLPAFKLGHYGLRMFRQTLDARYGPAIWVDMARVASSLNEIAWSVHTQEQVDAFVAKRIESYSTMVDPRGQLRYSATRNMPEYIYLGIDLLGPMARANEYGLKHLDDARLREIIRRYDFAKYATNEGLIRAWAAQLANQVYWLRQLGEQDVVEPFIEAFRATYPDDQDAILSDQQFMNKLYGMTHIVIAASEYYQVPVKESDFQWIFDYYRTHIDSIIDRSKEDVFAEIAINFLLAGLDSDPVVEKCRKALQQAIDRKAGLVPSVDGETDLVKGEHRNVLTIMVLDWRGTNVAPTVTSHSDLFRSLPYGLVPK